MQPAAIKSVFVGSVVGALLLGVAGLGKSIRPGHHWSFPLGLGSWRAGSVAELGSSPSSPFGANLPLLSCAYMIQPRPSCFILLIHWMPCAFCLALDKAGSSIAARIAMMAMTTSNSIKVNPRRHPEPEVLFAGKFEIFIGLFMQSTQAADGGV